MADLYTPHSDSLAGRVVTYFRRFPDPDEALSCADIAIKWDADQKNVPTQLAKSVAAGLLARDGMMYCAGPEIERITVEPMTLPEKPAMKRKRIAPFVNIEQIEFEDAPQAALLVTTKTHDRWRAKMATMPAGKSFAMPVEHRHALRTAATSLCKIGWKISVLNEGTDKVRVVCSAVGEKP